MQDQEATTVEEAAEVLESAFDEEVGEQESPSITPEDDKEEEEEEAQDPEDESEEESPEPDQEEPEEDAEEESEEEAPEEESTEEPEVFEVEVDGETYEVTLEELGEGYIRQETFTKRLTELNDEFVSKVDEVQSIRQQLVEELEGVALQGSVELQQYRNVDWDTLKARDPAAYKEHRLRFIELQEKVDAVKHRREGLKALHSQAEKLKHDRHVQRQMELATQAIPELKNPETVQKLIQFGQEVGLSEAEVRSIDDARELFILNQARLYQESQRVRKEVEQRKEKKVAPKGFTPGAKEPANAEALKSTKRLKERLRATHSMDDAAMLLTNYI